MKNKRDSEAVINKIYAYKNPFEINRMSIWEDIRKYPSLCISQTLVEGFKSYYGRENFTVLCTIDKVLKKIYKSWYDDKEVNIQQNIEISNIIDRWGDEKSKDYKLVKTLNHNKKEIIKAIKFLIESSIESNFDIEKMVLSDEEKALLEIYLEVKDRKNFSLLNNSNLSKESLNNYYIEILQDELKKYINDKNINKKKISIIELKRIIKNEINEIESNIKELNQRNNKNPLKKDIKFKDRQVRKINKIKSILKVLEDYESNKRIGEYDNKIFLYGIHQFTPLILKFISDLNKLNVEVIAVINYDNKFSEIYKTWKNVYSWTGIEFIEEGDSYRDKRKIGENIGKVYENELGKIKRNYTEEYIKYDNLTSFSDYVGDKFSEAEEEFNKFPREKNSAESKLTKIALMKEQFYALGSDDINKLLKVYFPEQFSERHFLTYPIGQFILSLYNMWDDTQSKILIEEENLQEALSLTIWNKPNMPTALEIFDNIKYYFKDINTFDNYIKRLKKLKQLCSENKYSDMKRVSFFIHTEEELDYFEKILINIKNITENLFANEKDNLKKNFQNLMKNIDALLINPTAKNQISIEELEMLSEIKDRLEYIDDTGADTYIKNIKETVGLYLKQNTSEEYQAEWIVRDFEQIDGGVLLAAAQKRDEDEGKEETTIHYAGLSDENILGRVKKELPWPLSDKLYREFDSNISNICAKSKAEYSNFLVYSLFYGTYFLTDNKKITFSYIQDIDGNKSNPYSVINDIIGIKAGPPNRDSNSTEEKNKVNCIAPTKVRSSYINNMSTSEMNSIKTCFIRYILNHCLDKDTTYNEKWQVSMFLPYYLTYNYLTKHNKTLNDKSITLLINDFPFLSKYEIARLKKSISNKPPIYDLYKNNRFEFISRLFKDPKIDVPLQDVIFKFHKELNSEINKKDNEYNCVYCNQRKYCNHYFEMISKDE